MDRSLSSSSTEDVSQLSPDHDIETNLEAGPEEKALTCCKNLLRPLSRVVHVRELEDDKNIRVKSKNPLGESGEDEEKMNEHQAVCLRCWQGFIEDDVLKTKCKCPFALIHEACQAKQSATKGNKCCSNCKQEIEYVPVTLLKNPTPPTPPTPKFHKKRCSRS